MTLIIRLLEAKECEAAIALELAGYPEDEAASLESLQYRQEKVRCSFIYTTHFNNLSFPYRSAKHSPCHPNTLHLFSHYTAHPHMEKGTAFVHWSIFG